MIQSPYSKSFYNIHHRKNIINIPSVKQQPLLQYTIGEKLGHGGFSDVYKAFNNKNQNQYAIKVIPRAKLKSEGDIRRLQQGIDSLSFFKHDNIIHLYDLLFDSNNLYLVLDLCSEGDLNDCILERDKLPECIAAVIFKQICSALLYIHSYSVAHRDIKLENILVDKFPHIKIADFGLCGFCDNNNNNLFTTFCGSLSFCAPECLSHKSYDGFLSDTWSVGVVLYHLVTGNSPWGTNQSRIVQQISKAEYIFPEYVSLECRDLISRLLQINPNNRISLQEAYQHKWCSLENSLLFPMPQQPLLNNNNNNNNNKNQSLKDIIELRRSLATNRIIDGFGIIPPPQSTAERQLNEPYDAPMNLALMTQLSPSLPSLANVNNFTIPEHRQRTKNSNYSPLNLQSATGRLCHSKLHLGKLSSFGKIGFSTTLK